MYQFNQLPKRAHYAGIKSFNHLPTHMKCAANEIQAFE
jgi:hypothetical protein